MSSGLLQVFVELGNLHGTTSFIETTGVACSDSVCHVPGTIRTGDPRGFNKGRSSKFREGSWVRQTPEEGRRIYRPKRCGNNNKGEDNSPKNLNDKNQQASSQKFRQLISSVWTLHAVKRTYQHRGPIGTDAEKRKES